LSTLEDAALDFVARLFASVNDAGAPFDASP